MILKDFGYTPLPIDFKEDGHSYKLDGIPLIGTTTVINCKAKDFLKWWTVKLMYQTLQKTWDIKKVYTDKEKEELLLTGKNAHAQKTDKACDSGKLSHKLIQQSIEKNTRYKPEGIKHENKSVQIEIRNIYANWLAWEKAHKVEYLATELVVGSRELWTGGTIDAVAIVDDNLELLDWKSSSRLSDDVCIQTAGYKFMLIEGGVSYDIKRRAVRLDKEKVGYNKDDDKLIRTLYQNDVECFKALITVYRWNRDINKTKVVKGN